MMAAKLQSIRTLCHGCLSADRDLSPIGGLSNMFRMICDSKARVPIHHLKYTSFCWECMATLKRMQMFHKQVKNAQTILKFYVRTKDKSLPKSLSRLKTTRTNQNFISLIELDESNTDIKPLNETKEEKQHDEKDSKQEDDADFFAANKEEEYLTQDSAFFLNEIKEEEHHDEKDSKQEDDADFFAAYNEEEDLTQDSAFILVIKDSKNTPQQQNEKPYCPINTAEEMCVKKRARPKQKFLCDHCGKKYSSKLLIQRHISRHHTEHKCNQCSRTYSTYKGLRDHISRVHARRKQKFLCDHCGKKYSSKLLIQRHISRHHTEHKCNQCLRTYSTYKGLRDHTSRVHDEVDRTEYCIRCNKKYKNRQNFEYHLRNSVAHADEHGRDKKSIKCLACDKCFALKFRMMEHYQYMHLGIRKFYCGVCDKNFCRKDRYKMHIRYKHEGLEKPRHKICSVCGRGFSQARILENHMRTHTGERPFACAVCDARFAQKVARDMHQNRHCRQNKAD